MEKVFDLARKLIKKCRGSSIVKGVAADVYGLLVGYSHSCLVYQGDIQPSPLTSRPDSKSFTLICHGTVV